MMKYAILQTESHNCPEENDETLSERSPPGAHSSPRPDRLNPRIPPNAATAGPTKMADGHPYSCGSALSSYDLGLPSGCDAPYPSRADGCPSCPHLHKGAWPPPSYGNSYGNSYSYYSGGGYSDSLLPFCPPPSECSSLAPGQDGYPCGRPRSSDRGDGSLERPLSLRSVAPAADVHKYYPTPYPACPPAPQGPACCPHCPAEGFRTAQSPRRGYRLPYGHPGPDHLECPGTDSTHSVYPHAHLRQNTALCAPLSLEQRKVFVTYEADSEKHVNEIIKFVALLRHNGFDTRIDVFEQHFRSISKIDFMEKFINEKDYLIIIAISPKYYEMVTGAPVFMENDERTLNTVYIHKQLQNEFIQNGCRNFRFIPILFPGAKKHHVPTWLQNTHVYSWPKDRDDILRRLMRVEKYNPPPIGQLPTIVSVPL